MKPRLVLLALVGALTAACEPTCKQTCRTLIECEAVDSPRQGLEDCQASCEIQQRVYEDWEDTQKRDALAELKRCIQAEECEAIADGACYDDELFVW